MFADIADSMHSVFFLDESGNVQFVDSTAAVFDIVTKTKIRRRARQVQFVREHTPFDPSVFQNVLHAYVDEFRLVTVKLKQDCARGACFTFTTHGEHRHRHGVYAPRFRQLYRRHAALMHNGVTSLDAVPLATATSRRSNRTVARSRQNSCSTRSTRAACRPKFKSLSKDDGRVHLCNLTRARGNDPDKTTTLQTWPFVLGPTCEPSTSGRPTTGRPRPGEVPKDDRPKNRATSETMEIANGTSTPVRRRSCAATPH